MHACMSQSRSIMKFQGLLFLFYLFIYLFILAKWSSSLLLLLLCMFVCLWMFFLFLFFVFFFKVELITSSSSSLYVCLSVMGVAHFSLFLGGREREREREREMAKSPQFVGVSFVQLDPHPSNNKNLTKTLCFRRRCTIAALQPIGVVSLLFSLLGFSRISLSIGQRKDTDTHRELREGELRQTVFES